MTGLLNLRSFEQLLDQQQRYTERDGQPYGLLMIDIEGLQQVNEEHGYEVGNEILVVVAAAINRSIRKTDVAARFGGDEFVVLLPLADAVTGAVIAQRIRNNVYAGTVRAANRLLRVTVNVGAATYPTDYMRAKELLMLAHQRMQQDRDLRRPVVDS